MVVVVGGNVIHHVKREGKCPGRGNVRGWDMSEEEMSRGNVRIPDESLSGCKYNHGLY